MALKKPVGTNEDVFLRRAVGSDGRPAFLPMDRYANQSLRADRGTLDPSDEMAHLIEPTHGARFAALMDRHMPEWPEVRKLLNRLPARHEHWEY